MKTKLKISASLENIGEQFLDAPSLAGASFEGTLVPEFGVAMNSMGAAGGTLATEAMVSGDSPEFASGTLPLAALHRQDLFLQTLRLGAAATGSGGGGGISAMSSDNARPGGAAATGSGGGGGISAMSSDEARPGAVFSVARASLALFWGLVVSPPSADAVFAKLFPRTP